MYHEPFGSIERKIAQRGERAIRWAARERAGLFAPISFEEPGEWQVSYYGSDLWHVTYSGRMLVRGIPLTAHAELRRPRLGPISVAAVRLFGAFHTPYPIDWARDWPRVQRAFAAHQALVAAR